MRLEHESAEELKAKLRELVSKHVDLKTYRLFFFGSRVRGQGDERSDVDVGIEGPDRLSSIAKFEIEEELENLRTLYKIELVDFKDVSDDFRRVALQSIEPIE